MTIFQRKMMKNLTEARQIKDKTNQIQFNSKRKLWGSEQKCAWELCTFSFIPINFISFPLVLRKWYTNVRETYLSSTHILKENDAKTLNSVIWINVVWSIESMHKNTHNIELCERIMNQNFQITRLNRTQIAHSQTYMHTYSHSLQNPNNVTFNATSCL